MISCMCYVHAVTEIWDPINLNIKVFLDESVLYESVESRFEPKMTCRHAAWKARRVLFCWQLSLVHVCSFLSHIRLQKPFSVHPFFSKCLLVTEVNVVNESHLWSCLIYSLHSKLVDLFKKKNCPTIFDLLKFLSRIWQVCPCKSFL